MRAIGLAVAVLLVAGLAATQAVAADLVIKGLKGETRTVTQAEFQALPHVEARIGGDGAQTVYSGVRVGRLLSLIGVTPEEELRGPQLALVMIFTASDGYRVALPLAEIDPDFRSSQVIVADVKAGQPLDAKEGPFRLIVEGDKRPARSARNLVAVELRSLP